MSDFLVGVLRLLATLVAVGLVVNLLIRRRYRRLAQKRPGEGLEQFKSHFAGRDVPDEVLETVYRGLGEMVGVAFPVRPGDQVVSYGLVEHFGDFLDQVLSSTGRRASRRVVDEATEKLKSVEDVVLFIASCPAAA